jgi:hypothetical protein
MAKKQPPHFYAVEKYPNKWETMSMPKSWKSVTTTAADNPDWLEDRQQLWKNMRLDYIKQKAIWDRIQQDRKDAKFKTMRNQVVREAARVARLKSTEFKAEREATAARRRALKAAAATAEAERQALKTLEEASRPKTARELRAEKKANKTRKNRR